MCADLVVELCDEPLRVEISRLTQNIDVSDARFLVGVSRADSLLRRNEREVGELDDIARAKEAPLRHEITLVLISAELLVFIEGDVPWRLLVRREPESNSDARLHESEKVMI